MERHSSLMKQCALHLPPPPIPPGLCSDVPPSVRPRNPLFTSHPVSPLHPPTLCLPSGSANTDALGAFCTKMVTNVGLGVENWVHLRALKTLHAALSIHSRDPLNGLRSGGAEDPEFRSSCAHAQHGTQCY